MPVCFDISGLNADLRELYGDEAPQLPQDWKPSLEADRIGIIHDLLMECVGPNDGAIDAKMPCNQLLLRAVAQLRWWQLDIVPLPASIEVSPAYLEMAARDLHRIADTFRSLARGGGGNA